MGKCSHFMCGFFDLAKAKHTLSLWVLKSKQYCEKNNLTPLLAFLPILVSGWVRGLGVKQKLRKETVRGGRMTPLGRRTSLLFGLHLLTLLRRRHPSDQQAGALL